MVANIDGHDLTASKGRSSDLDSWILDNDWEAIIKEHPNCEELKSIFIDKEVTFDITKFNAIWKEREVEPTDSTGDCVNSIFGSINMSIHKFFKTLKQIKKYEKLYIQGAAGKIADLRRNINKTAGAIAGALRILVSAMRNWLMKQLRKIVDRALEFLLPNLAGTVKESLIEAILDQIFCIIEKIIAGLIKFVGDFLYALLGQIINTPFCAIERWTNALINSLVHKVDNALAPIFDKINDILQGVAKISGSVIGIIDKILGFEGLFCEAPNCKEFTDFNTAMDAGFKKDKDAWDKFSFISDSFDDEIEDSVEGWMDDFFGEGANVAPESPYQFGGSCYAGDFSCGVPDIILFGGGGSGAVATAVINSIGEVIGTNLISGGSGYTSPPFVTIQDPADCGAGGGGYANIEDGIVTEIVITQTGHGYNNTNHGGPPFIQSFYAAPNPVNVGQTVTLSWDVINADSVSLNIPGYTDLAPVGTISAPILPDEVVFQPGSSLTTLKYTLTARRQKPNSGEVTSKKDYILTVNDVGDAPPPDAPNTNPPVIDLFLAEPGNPNSNIGYSLPGDVITLTWQTTNTTDVSLDVPGYSVLPLDGAVSIIIPPDINIPDTQGGVTIAYTLTATNVHAPLGQNTISNTVNVLIKSNPDSEVADEPETVVVPPDTTPATDTGGNSVPVIDGIEIINTGEGYTPEDTAYVAPGSGGNGAEFELDVNDIGQIIGVNVISSGFGYARIPRLRINSKQGVGVQFRTKLKFIPISEFLKDQEMEISQLDPNKLVQVIDCV